jgi:hypothetical protein
MSLRRSALLLLIVPAACTFDSAGLSSPRTWPDLPASIPDQRGERPDRRVLDRRADGPALRDKSTLDASTPTDGPPPPDTRPADARPSADTKKMCAGCAGVCCDKGQGLQCYLDAAGCACDLTTNAPCKGTSYFLCCDKWTGPKCTSSYADCACDPASSSPCSASTYNPICCNRGQGPRCGPNLDGCLCDKSSGKPCSGYYDTCCHVNSTTYKCHSWPC